MHIHFNFWLWESISTYLGSQIKLSFQLPCHNINSYSITREIKISWRDIPARNLLFKCEQYYWGAELSSAEHYSKACIIKSHINVSWTYRFTSFSFHSLLVQWFCISPFPLPAPLPSAQWQRHVFQSFVTSKCLLTHYGDPGHLCTLL